MIKEPFSHTCPMTVMLLTDMLGPIGGAERSLYLLARGLRERGHRIIICCLEGGDVSTQMRNEAFRVEDLGMKRIYGLKGVKSFFKLIKIAIKENVYVILSYHESSDYMGVFLSLLTRIPIISSRRDMGFKLKPRHVWLYRLLNHFLDGIAAVSEAVKKSVVKTQWVKQSKITVIYNGVDSFSSSFQKALNLRGKLPSIEVNDRSVNVCCVANIRPIKGQRYLIDAARLVANRFPRVRFYLVGKHYIDKNYYAEILAKVQHKKLKNVVKFTGGFPPSLIPVLLNSMDVLVLPSLSEGMSNVLLESMNAGVPVVATSVGGNPEVVEDGKTGFLVPPRNPHSIAEALLKLLSNPELRSDMGMRGRSRVESEFGLNRMVERYEDLLQYVILRRKIGRWPDLHSKLRNMIQQVKSWIKISLASMIYYSRLIDVLRRTKRALRQGKVKILCLHDVSEMAEGRKPFSIYIHPSSFASLLDFLAKNYQIVSLEEAICLLETGKSLTDDVFALTFDDCYKGWINHVFPECQRLRVPYTIFVSTGPLDSGTPLLYDALIFLAKNTWRKVVDLSPWELGVYLLDNILNIYQFVEEIHQCWRGRGRENRTQFLRELSNYLEVPLNAKEFENNLLNWDDVRKMDMYSVTIGAHSVSHAFMCDLSESECYWEIYQSKKRLEEELGHSIRFFAYPYGVLDYHKHDTTRIAKKAGFRNAFTLGTSNTNQFRPFKIGRHSLSPGMFLGLNGDFHKALFATELCCLGNFLFDRVFTQRMHRRVECNSERTLFR